MRKASTVLAIAAVFAAASLLSCASAPKAAAASADELDLAIREASDYLNGRIPRGDKIAFINIQSNSTALTEYIIDGLIENTVNDGYYTVVDRQQLEAIRAELSFQYSGDVDDNSAQTIGKMLGAKTIVTGAINPMGSMYRLRVRALAVESAQIQGQFSRNIPDNKTIAALLADKSGGGTAGGSASNGNSSKSGSSSPSSAGGQASSGGQAEAAVPAQPSPPAVPVYKVGGAGPAGGLVFYDKGKVSGGWRYLEAAPADIPQPLNAVTEGVREVPDTRGRRGVGEGKISSEEMMQSALNKNGGGFGWAVQACDTYELNGFDDWFLPSRDELHYMYGNLHKRDLGDFRNEKYWSSTGNGFWYDAENFADGAQDGEQGPVRKFRVRPVRQF